MTPYQCNYLEGHRMGRRAQPVPSLAAFTSPGWSDGYSAGLLVLSRNLDNFLSKKVDTPATSCENRSS